MNYPLKDINIVVTRDPAQSGNLIDKLTELGGRVYALPTIRISPPADWASCDNALNRINEFHWLLFSSTNGVKYFLDRAREQHGISHFNSSIAAVGKKTADLLHEYGIRADLIPASYSAEGLLESFGELDIREQKILIPTSDRSGDQLPDGLREMGAMVEKIICYRTENTDPDISDSAITSVLTEKMDCFTFYSPSSFLAMLKLLDNRKLKDVLAGNTVLAAIGPATARVIRKHGYEVRIQPEISRDESLIEAIVAYFNKKKLK